MGWSHLLPKGASTHENRTIRETISTFDDGFRSGGRLSRGRTGSKRSLARGDSATSTIDISTDRTHENGAGYHGTRESGMVRRAEECRAATRRVVGAGHSA